MFTGIISAIGMITHASGDAAKRIRIACAWPEASFKLGESIACNGACLTVVEKGTHDGAAYFDVELSTETLACTAPRWQVNDAINLERALKVGDDVSGHFVTGHVDGMATLEEIIPHMGSYQLWLRAPDALARFVAAKGSVTLDGISLTVNAVEGTRFTVTIIPHSWKNTTLSQRKAGDHVNMEVDLLARYLDRLLTARAA